MDRHILSNLTSLFRFPFQGHDWANRFIVGCALLFAGWVVPIVPVLFIYGYAVDLMRRVIRGDEPSLPPWENWGRLFVDGLRAWVVGLVYLLPGTVILVGGFMLYMVGSFGMIPLAERQPPDALLFSFFVLIGVYFLSYLVGSLLFFLGLIPLPAATAHFVAEDRLGAAFQVRRWWAVLRERGWEYLIVWILLFGITLLIYLILMGVYSTMCLCWLVPILAAPMAFYTTLVAAALFGLVWRDYAIRTTE
ncbi:MAG: DUF4013 domain-containing protein [Anaerolineae bacterium]|nr:DUF4013 domain-containing protein [Anaerolineae bacterium]MDW8067430.1 DUF4013 domain-containing protein [Anaerolineae bacterium]